MRTADVVVIGGGCVGLSALYHLALLGCTDAVLLEGDALGAGSTGKAAGGIRVQHQDELNTRLVLRSLEEFTRFEELTGTPIDFKQVGYLYLFDDEADLASFSRAAQIQRRFGATTEVLGADAVRDLVPYVTSDDLCGATFCSLEGYATPEAVVQGYARAARRLGATIAVGTPVVEILTDEVGVRGVRTAQETISTREVVVAAGVASRELTRPLGFELPVHGQAHTIFSSSESGGVPDEAPLVIDYSATFYFRREGRGLIFAGAESDLEKLSGPATHRLPSIADISIERSWWGYYEMSPDRNAMIGQAPVPGLHYATGFSGHGFMQSPAVGEHLAEVVLRREPTFDLSPMSVDRFAHGHKRAETFGV
jgi:sarcosine oxidase, subunit beta